MSLLKGSTFLSPEAELITDTDSTSGICILFPTSALTRMRGASAAVNEGMNETERNQPLEIYYLSQLKE